MLITVLSVIFVVFLVARAIAHHATTNTYGSLLTNPQYEIEVVKHFIGWEIIAVRNRNHWNGVKTLGYTFTRLGAKARVRLWEWNLDRYRKREQKSFKLEEL